MARGHWVAAALSLGLGGPAMAQEYYEGPASVGSNEPLFPYDDQEPWKHGYLQIMPYYGGHHFFRPYNYKHVFAQSQTAAAWGMSPATPYSQQFWHRYEHQTNLSNPRSANPPLTPTPAYNYGYPTPVPSTPYAAPAPIYSAPAPIPAPSPAGPMPTGPSAGYSPSPGYAPAVGYAPVGGYAPAGEYLPTAGQGVAPVVYEVAPQSPSAAAQSAALRQYLQQGPALP